MTIIDILTPKDTEEVKPNFFIQKKGNHYRQVSPMAWNGKMLWKNAILGPNWKSHLAFFLILMFICWAYVTDNKTFIEQDKMIKENPMKFCAGILEADRLNEQMSNQIKPINFTFIKDVPNDNP